MIRWILIGVLAFLLFAWIGYRVSVTRVTPEEATATALAATTVALEARLNGPSGPEATVNALQTEVAARETAQAVVPTNTPVPPAAATETPRPAEPTTAAAEPTSSGGSNGKAKAPNGMPQSLVDACNGDGTSNPDCDQAWIDLIEAELGDKGSVQSQVDAGTDATRPVVVQITSPWDMPDKWGAHTSGDDRPGSAPRGLYVGYWSIYTPCTWRHYMGYGGC